MKSFIYASLAFSALIVYFCQAAPEPAIVPLPDDWTVDVRFEHPLQIELRSAADNKTKRFWYVIITLINSTDRDVDFYPEYELMTDTFQIIPAGRGTAPVVFEQIKRRHQSRYPFLEPLEKVGDKILQGEDNAKDIAVIWPDFDLEAKTIKIFVAGLSNETAVVDHPVDKDKAGKPVKVFLRKSLELNYSLSGDPAFRSEVRLDFEGRSWVMR